jgi:hypothetical protein
LARNWAAVGSLISPFPLAATDPTSPYQPIPAFTRQAFPAMQEGDVGADWVTAQKADHPAKSDATDRDDNLRTTHDETNKTSERYW